MECLNSCGQMRQVAYLGEDIDICPDCIGIWLDDDELAKVLLDRDRSWPEELVTQILETIGGVGIPAGELERRLFCPACGDELGPVNYQGNSGVIVNTCARGHGVWLDPGELAKLQVFVDHWRDR